MGRVARPHLEHLRGPQHTLDPVLVEVGDAAVHELQKDLQVLVARPVQDHDQLPVEGRVAEELGEVGAAGGEDQAVGLEGLAWGQASDDTSPTERVRESQLARDGNESREINNS